jgi:uncharacterized protein (UPF0332 family)
MTDDFKDAPEYIEYARRVLRTGKLALDDGDWVSAINRAYYAVFYAANAVLELDGLQRSKHSGVMSLFREKYVKTGKIEGEYSDMYGQAFESRQESDYERTEFPSQEDAQVAVERAERFVARIEKFLNDQKKNKNNEDPVADNGNA